MTGHPKNVGLLERIVDFFLTFRRRKEKRQLEGLRALLINALDDERMEKILELLLKGMRLLLLVDRNYRANIRGFEARYAFAGQAEHSALGASAIFKVSPFFRFPHMAVNEEAVRDATVTVLFSDGRALAEFLLSPRPDIFSAILDNKLSFEGNLNYLFKFVYMARHIPKELGIELPAALHE